ncbi:unnamed protein product [Ectocarpus sp. CCAP 1310/34]|nr:unnamed protein product [Ectocarpus sp. CCAP 1310/34]
MLDEGPSLSPLFWPYFSALTPPARDAQAHSYRSLERASHTASGDGLHKATVGRSASFTIQLVGDQLGSLPDWKPNSSTRFIYVWIANKDQDEILIAEVADGGSKNGTLTATYKSDFPGDYLVYIDEVESSKKDEGVPILGSPFSLTIAGDAPTLDVNSLPVCSTHEDTNKDIPDTFWRSGTWLSSNVASAAHGVMRNGWVFQPKSCVFDTFSYEDLMLLASLDGEPTWLLVLGGSVQRGVFLTLIDMVLAAGQKHDIQSSVVQKCWGYADVRVGNLRLTYQVLMDALPPSWEGKLSFVDHMAGFGIMWEEENPTMTALEDVRMWYLSSSPDDDNGLGKMDAYETRDPRMYQAKLFENEQSKNGIRRFAVSQHFHYVSSDASGPETRNGTIMVHSTITEMLANVMIGRAVETKAKLYAKAAASTDEIRKMNAEFGKAFQVCSDCPSALLPFHVKAIPESVCEIVQSLPGDAKTGEAWPGSLCPDWCMKQAPVSQSTTQSGVVEVRWCRRKH